MGTTPELAYRGGHAIPTPDERMQWAKAHGTHPVVPAVLAARGIPPDRWLAYARPRLADLRPPTAMAGFEEALDVLSSAIQRGATIGIFGDYDVDGVTTAALLGDYLEACGARVVLRVAHRNTGYGFSPEDAQALVEAGARVVVTGDCGTQDVEALGWLRDRGIPTVVIDHHHVPEEPPPADAFLNPHQPDCGFPFKGLCSAGVAFYLCAALRSRRLRAGLDAPHPRPLLDLVALGTICDMVPLVEENRILARHGLDVLAGGLRPGLRALMELAGVEPKSGVGGDVVGFRIGPRLNAPGRLGAARPALDVLRARSVVEARSLADQVEAANAQRKAMTDRIQREADERARSLLARNPNRPALVLSDATWHPGVVGIAAGRLAEAHRRPVVVLAVDRTAQRALGSARTFGEVDVRAALEAASEHVLRFGGHRAAAGVTVPLASLPAFAQAFEAAVAEQGPESAADPPLEHDGPLSLRFLDESLVAALDHLGPYGVGFPPPTYVVEDATVASVRVLKGRHLRLRLRQGKAEHTAVGFGLAGEGVERGQRLSALVIPEYNIFRGRRRIQLRIVCLL